MEWFPSCPPPYPRCVNSSKQFCSRLIAIVSWLSHPMRNVIYWNLNKEAIDLTWSRSKLINWPWHVSYFIFFFRKISWSTCFGFRLALWAVTMSLAVEKTRSEETLVTGTVRYTCANLPSSWKRDVFIFHQIRGLSFILRSGSSRNRSTSSMASWYVLLASSTCVTYVCQKSVQQARWCFCGSPVLEQLIHFHRFHRGFLCCKAHSR